MQRSHFGVKWERADQSKPRMVGRQQAEGVDQSRLKMSGPCEFPVVNDRRWEVGLEGHHRANSKAGLLENSEFGNNQEDVDVDDARDHWKKLGTNTGVDGRE